MKKKEVFMGVGAKPWGGCGHRNDLFYGKLVVTLRGKPTLVHVASSRLYIWSKQVRGVEWMRCPITHPPYLDVAPPLTIWALGSYVKLTLKGVGAK